MPPLWTGTAHPETAVAAASNSVPKVRRTDMIFPLRMVLAEGITHRPLYDGSRSRK